MDWMEGESYRHSNVAQPWKRSEIAIVDPSLHLTSNVIFQLRALVDVEDLQQALDKPLGGHGRVWKDVMNPTP